MIQKITLQEYFENYASLLVVDVRSPGEYEHAQLPIAITLPLFTNEERAIVGTAYKQESREKAIKHGLDYFGPKMRLMVERIEEILASRDEKQVVVHCWRGGMRSGAVAWLLDLYGYEVYTLVGGYKAYRNYVLDLFDIQYKIKRLSGYTGSGKTTKLHELKKQGEQILDLEGLANHKGSAFGHIGMDPQPSQEMFENLIADQLIKMDNDKIIWVEDESMRIGHVSIPKQFFLQMRSADEVKLDVPFDLRLENIIKDYGSLDHQQIMEAVLRIKKRLGGLETQTILDLIEKQEMRSAFALLLKYYDREYDRNSKKVKNTL